MNNKEIIYAKNILVSLDGKSNEEKLKVSLYSIMTVTLLSKEIFKSNSDISTFLKSADINLKDYVYRSRTLIVSRMMREIEHASKEKLLLFTKELKQLLFSQEDYTKERKNKVSDNSVDDILRQFGRN